MSEAPLRELREQPFALLAELDRRLRATRFEAGEEQFWTGLAFRLGEDGYVVPGDEVREVLPLPTLPGFRVPPTGCWVWPTCAASWCRSAICGVCPAIRRRFRGATRG